MAPTNPQNPPKRKATEEPPSTPIAPKKLKMNEEELTEFLDTMDKTNPANINIIPFPEKVRSPYDQRSFLLANSS